MEHPEFDLTRVCLSFLTLDQLQGWMLAKKTIAEKAFQIAKKMSLQLPSEASGYLRMRENKKVNSYLEQLSNIIDSIINTFKTLFISWANGSFSVGMHDMWATSEILIKLLMIPLLGAYSLNALMTGEWNILNITTMIYLIAIVSLASYARLRPHQTKLPNCDNLTSASLEGRLTPTIGREAELEKVLQALMDRNVFLQPIVVAPSRTGKTKIIEKLSQFSSSALAKPPLKKVQWQVITPSSIGRWVYSRFAELIRLFCLIRDEEQHIFVFEELDQAMQETANWGQFSDFLKKELDARSNIRCIAVTTPEGYAKISKDEAFANRFKVVIPMDALSAIETTIVLQTYRRQTVTDVIVDNAAISKAVQLTKTTADKCQPEQAQTLLTYAINQIRYKYDYGSDRKLEKKRKKLKSLQYQYENSPSDVLSTGIDVENFKTLQLSVADREQKLEKRQKTLNKVQKVVAHYIQKKETHHQNIRQIASEGEMTEESVQKKFLLDQLFALPFMEKWLTAIETELHEPIRVNEALIQTAFEEMKKARETVALT